MHHLHSIKFGDEPQESTPEDYCSIRHSSISKSLVGNLGQEDRQEYLETVSSDQLTKKIKERLTLIAEKSQNNTCERPKITLTFPEYLENKFRDKKKLQPKDLCLNNSNSGDEVEANKNSQEKSQLSEIPMFKASKSTEVDDLMCDTQRQIEQITSMLANLKGKNAKGRLENSTELKEDSLELGIENSNTAFSIIIEK